MKPRCAAMSSASRSSIWLKASASVRTSSLRPGDVVIRGRRSPASTRAATAAIRRSGADTRAPARYDAKQRQDERNAAGEDKGACESVLGADHSFERLAGAGDYREPADADCSLEYAELAGVGSKAGREPEVRHGERSPERVLCRLLGDRLTVIGMTDAE